MKGLAISFIAFALALGCCHETASAARLQPDDPASKGPDELNDIDEPESFDETADYEASAVYDETAVSGPGLVNPVMAIKDSSLIGVLPPRFAAAPPCLQWVSEPVGDTGSKVVCQGELTCGYERIDDSTTGEISGADVTGRFAQYLSNSVLPRDRSPAIRPAPTPPRSQGSLHPRDFENHPTIGRSP